MSLRTPLINPKIGRLMAATTLCATAASGCTPVADTGQTAPPPVTPTTMPAKSSTKAAPALNAPTKAPAATPPGENPVALKTKNQKKGGKAVTGGVRVLEGGLKAEDVVIGSGREAKTGDSVTVHYKGTLTNGTKFDSSYDRGQPFTFTLGAGQVIKGWDVGVAGMKEGGKRKLTIPAPMAYGASSPSPTIPPNSTLLFDVELLKVG